MAFTKCCCLGIEKTSQNSICNVHKKNGRRECVGIFISVMMMRECDHLTILLDDYGMNSLLDNMYDNWHKFG